MNFEEFLEKESISDITENVIPIKALGEWALDWLIVLDFMRPPLVKKARIHEYNLIKEIAVACLGEDEIIKRLLDAV